MNWCLEGFHRSLPWLESYLNDLICIPFWVPIMLWMTRKLGLRRHDGPPEASEIVVPLIIWAMVFECVLPRLAHWKGLAVADPIDILWYTVGAFVASISWSLTYGHSMGQARQAFGDGAEHDRKAIE
jgi:hypothetical protein